MKKRVFFLAALLILTVANLLWIGSYDYLSSVSEIKEFEFAGSETSGCLRICDFRIMDGCAIHSCDCWQDQGEEEECWRGQAISCPPEGVIAQWEELVNC